MELKFQQWYLRQALANNLLRNLDQPSQNNGPSAFKSNLSSSVVNPTAKVIKPTVTYKTQRNNYCPSKSPEDIQKSGNSAFQMYVKQRVNETETPDFIRGCRIKLKPYDIKGSQTHQNFSKSGINNETLGCNTSGSTLFTCENMGNGETHTGDHVQTGFNDDNFEASVNETSMSKSSGSKSNFKLRTDVVNKAILRAFKKYYTNSFKSFYDFTKVRKSEVNNDQFLSKADEFITKYLGESKFGDMHIFLASIVDTKQKYSNINQKYDRLKAQINSLLYSFNKRKVESLLSYPEFSSLLLHFLSQPNIIEQIVKSKEDGEAVKVYRKQMDNLRDRCTVHLRSSKL